MRDKVSDIKSLFEPRPVAIIGASHSKNKIGYKIVRNVSSDFFKIARRSLSHRLS